jgi:hypothetical protein
MEMATDVAHVLCRNVTNVSVLRLADREDVRGDADLIGELNVGDDKGRTERPSLCS